MIAGANCRKAQRLELAARLASAAGGGRARGERDRISYRFNGAEEFKSFLGSLRAGSKVEINKALLEKKNN